MKWPKRYRLNNIVLIMTALVCFACPAGPISAAATETPAQHSGHTAPPSEVHDHKLMIHTADVPGNDNKTRPEIGVHEKPGDYIPLDLVFLKENGKPVTLEEIISKPVILALIFYHCPQACNMIQGNLAASLNRASLSPGQDYQVISLSFDAEETPAHARQAKSNYLAIFDRPFPKNQWHFLTGKRDAIEQLTNAVGFKFGKIGRHNFVHPNVLIVIAPDGQIIRYLHGLSYLPFDVGMAITEASRGTPGISVRRIMSYCFSYDSQNRKYVFKTFRIVGVVMLFSIGAFYFFFLRKRPASRRKASG